MGTDGVDITAEQGGAAVRSKLKYGSLTEQIIGAVIEVHKVLGPGLLESAYEECLCHELALRGLRFARQVTVPVAYKASVVKSNAKVCVLP